MKPTKKDKTVKKDKKLNFRSQNVDAMDKLYFRRGDKTRNHVQVHKHFIEEMFGITENTTQNDRSRVKKNQYQEKPSGHITATLQTCGAFFTCVQIGFPMPKPGPLTNEYLAEYFSKAAIREKEFNEKKNKTVKQQMPMK